MPPANEYRLLDPSISADRELIDAADAELRARGNVYTRAWDYYDGNQPEPLKYAQGKINNNVLINVVSMTVDRTVHFLFPDMPGIELDANSESETPDETYLNGAWEHNQNVVPLLNLAVEGALTGHVFARVQPQPDEGEPPELYCLAGRNIICHWAEDDKDTLLWYEVRYASGRKQYRQDIVNDEYQSGVKQWLIYEYVQVREGKWELRTDLPDNPVIWPYELGPIVDWQHLPDPRNYYGKPEMGNGLKLLDLQNAINKAASDYKAITRVHAAPRTVATGVRAEEMQTVAGVDNFWALPDKDAKVYNIEMQSDLSALMNFIRYLSEAFFAQTRTTMLSGGVDAYKSITNLGIKAAFMDMLAKNSQLQRQYGRGIAEISKRFLMLGNFDYNVKPKIVWATPLPTSDLEETQIAQQQIDMGVLSKETAAGALGLDWQTEQDRLAAEGDTAQTALDRQMARTPFPFDTPQDAARRSMQVQAQDMMRGGNGNS